MKVLGRITLLLAALLPLTAAAAPMTVMGPNGEEYHTGLLPAAAKAPAPITTLDDCDNLPESYDLREVGTVSPVRDQGQCGSCWAFSKTSALESAVLAAGGQENLAGLDLSEQELVSNDTQQYGCSGGNLEQTEYQTSHGQGLEKDFPYTARDSAARSIPVAAKSVSWVHLKPYDETQLKCALYKTHTVPWITGSANSWGGFPSTENEAHTSCGRGQTNHAIGVVGWKVLKGQTYFIMRNSWGTSWGAKGYGLLKLGCDSFGDEIAYPTVH